MTRQAASMKKTRNRYSPEFKGEALALADRVGATTAAREPSLQTSQLYQWRAKAQQKANTSEREQALADENARLKRQLAEKSEELEIAKKATVYFARSLK
ncbi:transposase [Salinicola rhizosphaerae]|uniref:Transposase n=1 Tax=Salinicola rhizosphaerae TaxID=1443141 RepID=A0ABQ3EFD4_9GAMM|nr:transposase [Salinicola rhizosphaerae]